MGWLDRTPDKVVEFSGPAEIRLEALEADPLRSSLPKIAILHTGAEGRDVYLSFRAASAANPLPDDVLKGVNIHIFAKGRKKGGNTLFAASLADGEVYRDGSLSVTQLSHVPGESVTVRVGFSAMAPASSAGALQSAASNKCLDLAGGSKADGAAVIQYDCHQGPNQQWTLETSGGQVRVVSRLSGKCLGGGVAGAAITQAACAGAPDQSWSRTNAAGGFVLRNVASGLCLDLPGASAANGVHPANWACNGAANQTWRLAP